MTTPRQTYYRKIGETTLLPVTEALAARARKRGDLVLVYEDGTPVNQPIMQPLAPAKPLAAQGTPEDFARQFARQPEAPPHPLQTIAPANTKIEDVVVDNRTSPEVAPTVQPSAGVVVTGDVVHKPQAPETIPDRPIKPPLIDWSEIESINLRSMKKTDVIGFAKSAFDLELSEEDSLPVLKKRLTAHIELHRPKPTEPPAAPPAE